METEITVRMGMVGEIGINAGEYYSQKDAYETNQTSNAICGRNVGCNKTTRTWDEVKRDENGKVGVRSDTQRKYRERTLTRDNESGEVFQEDH